MRHFVVKYIHSVFNVITYCCKNSYNVLKKIRQFYISVAKLTTRIDLTDIRGKNNGNSK